MVDTTLLTAEFWNDFGYNGTLEFHDAHTVSVKEDELYSGSVGVRPHVTELGWKFLQVEGTFTAQGSALTTLEGAPPWIGDALYVRNCPNLTSLGSTLSYVGGSMTISGTALSSLKGGPKTVKGHVILYANQSLVSLEGFPVEGVDKVEIDYTPTLPLLRLLVSPVIWLTTTTSGTSSDTAKVEKILDKYAGQGKRAVFKCKKELIEAGFEGNARW